MVKPAVQQHVRRHGSTQSVHRTSHHEPVEPIDPGPKHRFDVLRDMLDAYPRFLINFGGDIYGRGGWNIGLESPFTPDEVVGTLYLDDLYVACSAPTRRRW